MINFQKIRIKFHYNIVMDWDRKGQAATLQKFRLIKLSNFFTILLVAILFSF